MSIQVLCPFYFLNVFAFGCAEWSLLLHGLSLVEASHCRGSSCGARALGMWGSVVGVPVLSCPMAHGIFPGQGLNLCPCTGRQTLTACATREAPFQVDFCIWCEVRVQFSSTIGWKDCPFLSFPHQMVLAPLLKIIWQHVWGLKSGLWILFHRSGYPSLC